ncbi:virB8 family protein [Duganella sp. BuS-21]|uniref:virB8 family protein n=1 Tax=Duganella sp. BuS-21 TaxID=2943848 RepID=UPI0035A6A656
MSNLPPQVPAARIKADENFPPWEVKIDELLLRSERRAWWVAGVASIIALTAIVALAMLAPYRRYIPFLLGMDRVNGNVEVIGAIDDRTVKGYQELVDKYWVQRYVSSRTSYFYRLLQEDYDTTLELSEGQARTDYMREYEGTDARDKRYGANVEVQVKIVSIQLFSNGVGQQASVRFSKTTRHLDSNTTEPVQFAIATIGYRYQPSMFAKEIALIRNPLGFKVSVYRVANELAPTVSKPEKAAGDTGE